MANASARVDYWRRALGIFNCAEMRQLLSDEIDVNNRPVLAKRGAKETEWAVFRSNIEAQVAKFK